MNQKEIGTIIKERRKHLGVNQQTLADLAGVGINTLVAIERGEGNPQLSTLLTILETLGLTIDLHIKSGETIGILGGTGSSKSTLIQLISRLYDATKGTVRVGGIDVRDYDLDTLRNEVSVVLQRNVLFSGTIKDNLRWGDPDATDEELEHACRLAQADEFIQLMPDKYDTYIEQGGTNVSGGQKQRLCIARALLKKPKILILDDSTSAVDTTRRRRHQRHWHTRRVAPDLRHLPRGIPHAKQGQSRPDARGNGNDRAGRCGHRGDSDHERGLRGRR